MTTRESRDSRVPARRDLASLAAARAGHAESVMVAMENAADEAGTRRIIVGVDGGAGSYTAGHIVHLGLVVARVIARGLQEFSIWLATWWKRREFLRGWGSTWTSTALRRDNTASQRASRAALLRRSVCWPVRSRCCGGCGCARLGRVLEANVYHYSRFAEILLCLALALLL